MEMKLEKLRQGRSSVDDYFTELMEAIRLADAEEYLEDTINRFLAGLRRAIRERVALRHYEELKDMVQYSIRVEKRLERLEMMPMEVPVSVDACIDELIDVATCEEIRENEMVRDEPNHEESILDKCNLEESIIEKSVPEGSMVDDRQFVSLEIQSVDEKIEMGWKEMNAHPCFAIDNKFSWEVDMDQKDLVQAYMEDPPSSDIIDQTFYFDVFILQIDKDVPLDIDIPPNLFLMHFPRHGGVVKLRPFDRGLKIMKLCLVQLVPKDFDDRVWRILCMDFGSILDDFNGFEIIFSSARWNTAIGGPGKKRNPATAGSQRPLGGEAELTQRSLEPRSCSQRPLAPSGRWSAIIGKASGRWGQYLWQLFRSATTILSLLHLHMAACGIGHSALKIKNLDFGSVRPKSRTLQPLRGLKTTKIVQIEGLVLLHRQKKPIILCRSSASVDESAKVNVEDDSKEILTTDAVSTLIPNAFEVESLLTVLCDTTSIAEFELKLGGFRLYVSRNLTEQSAPPQPPAPAAVTAHAIVETPGSNGSASSHSLALSKPISSSGGVQSLLDKAADEGLVILQSPRVGYFRRSRTIKGKKAPPSCKEKDTVKEGQVLCYIDQLGGEIPIESDICGEVVKILREDGDPVGYGDALIAVLPSFPGIKKLQ
ncbi:Single hybrid motif superfamily protein [Perilla frutescens var. hirtella]|uniref:Single hybrid motif superfamily protein n=1 Tax=Perilla frutescens var. hirtella TaxID=608512 RepID=A0AAD4IPZ8_PERFH|nr:Single hybrid motif superfamily protein [Perilla frutescens var. hirtella]